MELASLFGSDVERDLGRQLEAVAGLRAGRWRGLHRDLARRHGVHILAASGPARAGGGRFHNRARLFSPEAARACRKS